MLRPQRNHRLASVMLGKDRIGPPHELAQAVRAASNFMARVGDDEHHSAAQLNNWRLFRKETFAHATLPCRTNTEQEDAALSRRLSKRLTAVNLTNGGILFRDVTA